MSVLSTVGNFVKGAVSGVGAVLDPIFGVYDRVQQNKTNQQNIAMQEQANAQNQANFDKSFAYQQDLNAQMMAREDSAMQRAVADAEKAGFSKWSVAGSGASASPMTSASGGQSVAQGAKNSTQISQTAYGAEMANMRASIAQADATKKKAEYEERWYDGQLKHMHDEYNLDRYKTYVDAEFGFADRHLKSQQLALEREKQEEVARNNKAVIEETIRHNQAVETETNRSNRVSEQQKSQSLDIDRLNARLREEELKLSYGQFKAMEERYKSDSEYREACLKLEKQGLTQRYAQMVVSGVVSLAGFVLAGPVGGVVAGALTAPSNSIGFTAR